MRADRHQAVRQCPRELPPFEVDRRPLVQVLRAVAVAYRPTQGFLGLSKFPGGTQRECQLSVGARVAGKPIQRFPQDAPHLVQVARIFVNQRQLLENYELARERVAQRLQPPEPLRPAQGPESGDRR